jgi:outer membrane protein TolC
MERYHGKQSNTILKSFLPIIIILLTQGLIAQDKWSLDDCIYYAVAHNLELKDLEYGSESGKETYRQSLRDLLPTINGFSDYNISKGRSTDPNTNDIVNTDFFSNNYSINSSIDIFRGFQKLNTVKASKFIYKATQEELLQQKYLLAFRVMSAFFDIAFYEGLLANSREQQAISQRNYDLVQRQIELGIKAGADLYEAESTLLTDKLAVTQAANQLENARLILRQAMNLERDIPLSLQMPLQEVETDLSQTRKNSDSVYNSAIGVVPILKAREYRAEAARKQVGVARGNLFPSLSLDAGYGTGYFETNIDNNGNVIPFRSQIKDNASSYIGVSLRIPISNGWSAHSRVKQQKIAQKQAANSLDLQKQELYQLIEQLVQENTSLKTEFEQSIKKVESQNLAYTIAQKRYEKGLLNAIDLFQAKNLYAEAQNENLQVRLRLQVNEKTLSFYEGAVIFNFNGIN